MKKIKVCFLLFIWLSMCVNSQAAKQIVYTYDDLNQLERIETEKGVINYSYDEVGNILQKSVEWQGEWQIYPVSGVNALEDAGILSLEFNNPSTFNYYHSVQVKGVKPSTTYKLSGYIKAENLVDNSAGVCLEVQDARGWVATHSAASTAKVKGSTDWVRVEVLYKTLSDASAVKIIARRAWDSGPLSGKVYFKDVKWEECVVVPIWTISPIGGINALEQDGVLSLEFVNPGTFNYYHSTQVRGVRPSITYKLSGYIKAENLVDNSAGVCLEVQDARGWAVTRSAASTAKVKGSTDWVRVEVLYKTLSDASAVKIIARRAWDSGPLSGKVYFKDVKWEEQ